MQKKEKCLKSFCSTPFVINKYKGQPKLGLGRGQTFAGFLFPDLLNDPRAVYKNIERAAHAVCSGLAIVEKKGLWGNPTQYICLSFWIFGLSG